MTTTLNNGTPPPNLFDNWWETATVPAVTSGRPLRPYQTGTADAVDAAIRRGVHRMLYTLPTGTGKTRVFTEIINRRKDPTRPAMVLAHRDELLDQARRSLLNEMPSLDVQIEQGPNVARSSADVVVASIQTLARQHCQRLDWLARIGPSVLIYDEAHHAASEGAGVVLERFGCFEGRTPLIGCTATPKRLDKKLLVGPHGAAVFEQHVYNYTILDAIKDGWLCPVRGYRVTSDVDLSSVATRGGDFAPGELADAVDDSTRTSAAIDRWEEVARTRPTIVFCASVDHAAHAADMWTTRGYSAALVHGGMGKEERTTTLDGFKAGRIQVLTNVQVLTEGFDHPPVSCVVMLRPTQSWGLFVQCVGRGTRIHPGKDDLIVLDVVDVTSKHTLCSTASILDLPPLDMQGRTLTEISDKIEALSEKRTRLPKEWVPGSYDELVTRLEAVDLLAEIAPIDPGVRDRTTYDWLSYPDGDGWAYRLGCGGYVRTEDDPARPGEKLKITLGQKSATIRRDSLGAWRIMMACQLPRVRYGEAAPEIPMEHLSIPETLRTAPGWDGLGDGDFPAFATAEAHLRTYWPYVGSIASSEAKWKGDLASDKQRAILSRNARRLGLSEGAIQQITKGEASRLLDKLFNKNI